MAWNEPDKEKDPWSRGNDGQKPPELDEVVKKLQKRFGSVLGGGGGGGGTSDVPPIPAALKLLILAAFLVAALFACRFTVDAGSRAVVQRLGKFHHIANPGWNWRIPWVDQIDIVQVDLSKEFVSKNEMLTGDANIISIVINVQYRQALAKDYVFNVFAPDETLQEVTDAAIRAVVGKYDIEYIQRQGRDVVASETKELIQTNLDRYGTGIIIDAINLTRTEFPAPVQAAAQDVIKAARDKERYILQAEAYRNDLIPKARGEAARQVEIARAYRDKHIEDAKGEANRFLAILAEFEAAPEVTRERLYLEAVEEVFLNTSKVVMDTEGSGNLLYLPVDKLMDNSRARQSPTNAAVQSGVQQAMDRIADQVEKNANPSAATKTDRLRSRDRNQ